MSTLRGNLATRIKEIEKEIRSDIYVEVVIIDKETSDELRVIKAKKKPQYQLVIRI